MADPVPNALSLFRRKCKALAAVSDEDVLEAVTDVVSRHCSLDRWPGNVRTYALAMVLAAGHDLLEDAKAEAAGDGSDGSAQAAGPLVAWSTGAASESYADTTSTRTSSSDSMPDARAYYSTSGYGRQYLAIVGPRFGRPRVLNRIL